MNHEHIPTTIQEAYEVDPSSTELLSGGSINKTYRASGNLGELILQRMHPQFPASLTNMDYRHVTVSLIKHGWEMPRLIKTNDGSYQAKDEDFGIWRATSYIESDSAPQTITPETALHIGSLLGSLQASLKDVLYIPMFRLPHFHDLGHQLRTLQDHYNNLPYFARTAANSIFEDASTYTRSIFKAVPQLIHGDPRVENILFRDDEPFTFIDWDTVMVDSPYLDIGDMLRSVMKFVDDPGWINIESITESILERYLNAGTLGYSDETRTLSLEAARDVSLGLACRYLTDCDPEKPPYFQIDYKDPVRQEYLVTQAIVNINRSRFFKDMMVSDWDSI